VTGAPATRAAAGFAEAYGRPPAGLWAAPGRANLIGEHTDYNDGFVLPFALPLRTVVAAAPADGPGWSVWSEQSGERLDFDPGTLEPGALSGWVTYVAGVVWALVDAGYDVPPARLAVASDVPLGAGLSSSAALEAAVLTALVDLGGLDLPVHERPALAQRAENVFAGAPCGIMDQSASIRCREGHALFLDCRSLEVEHIPFDLAAAGLALLVIDSRAPHAHATGEYADRRKACESAAATLGVAALRDLTPDDLAAALPRLDPVVGRRVRHVVTENQRVLDTVALLRAGEPRRVGPVLTGSHASMRDDFAITVAQVDVAVEAALAAGAHGARMTGGGFGGCVLALVEADAAGRVTAAVEGAYADRGFTPPVGFAATPGPGAVRLS
jgi:galactokinase